MIGRLQWSQSPVSLRGSIASRLVISSSEVRLFCSGGLHLCGQDLGSVQGAISTYPTTERARFLDALWVSRPRLDAVRIGALSPPYHACV